MGFAKLALSESIQQTLREEGYETPTPIQAEAIPLATVAASPAAPAPLPLAPAPIPLAPAIDNDLGDELFGVAPASGRARG